MLADQCFEQVQCLRDFGLPAAKWIRTASFRFVTQHVVAVSSRRFRNNLSVPSSRFKNLILDPWPRRTHRSQVQRLCCDGQRLYLWRRLYLALCVCVCVYIDLSLTVEQYVYYCNVDRYWGEIPFVRCLKRAVLSP